MKKIYTIFLSILLAIAVMPAFTFAQGSVSTGGTPSGTTKIIIDNPAKVGNTLPLILEAILKNIVMPIAAIAVVMYIIYAGFTFVTAQGNPKKIDDAKQRLLWALIGAGILLGAVGISQAVQNTVSDVIKL